MKTYQVLTVCLLLPATVQGQQRDPFKEAQKTVAHQTDPFLEVKKVTRPDPFKVEPVPEERQFNQGSWWVKRNGEWVPEDPRWQYNPHTNKWVWYDHPPQSMSSSPPTIGYPIRGPGPVYGAPIAPVVPYGAGTGPFSPRMGFSFPQRVRSGNC